MANHNHGHVQEHDGSGQAIFWVGLLVGLLIGGLASAVATLLLAPQSGKRTRAKIRRQSAEWREQAADTMDDAVAQARIKARQVTHDVSDKAEELKRAG